MAISRDRIDPTGTTPPAIAERPIAEPPIVIQQADERVPAALLVLVATVWIVVPMQAGWQDHPALGPFGACAPLIGALLALIGLARWCRRARIVIDRGVVEVTARHLTGERVRREPLAGFVGLSVHREERSHRYGPRRWHVLELRHADPTRSLALTSTRDPQRVDRRARELAARLGLPLVGAPCDIDPPAVTGCEATGRRAPV